MKKLNIYFPLEVYDYLKTKDNYSDFVRSCVARAMAEEASVVHYTPQDLARMIKEQIKAGQ